MRWYDWQAPFYRLWRNRYDDPLLDRIDELLPGDGGGSLLDVACGTGFASLGLARRRPGRLVVGVDLSPGMLRVADRERTRRASLPVRFVGGDVLALPIADACVDAVVVVGLIPFVSRPLDAARELARVVRPGGSIVSAEFDRDALTGLAGLAFRTMMIGHAAIARVVPAFRYADRWDVASSTIEPEAWAATLRAAGLELVRHERAHRHLIYVARRGSSSSSLERPT